MLQQLAPQVTPALFGLIFVEGLLAFLSPCILPMIPIYLLYLGGEEAAGERAGVRLFLNTLGFIAGLTPLILVLHLNRRFKLPDSWFVIGDSALLAGVGQIGIMPLLVLGAQTCPKQVEGTMYALLMSIINVGSVVSDNLGGLLTWAVGVTENDFHNLWILVLICNIANLLPIPLLYTLVPKEEDLAVHDSERAERSRLVPS